MNQNACMNHEKTQDKRSSSKSFAFAYKTNIRTFEKDGLEHGVLCGWTPAPSTCSRFPTSVCSLPLPCRWPISMLRQVLWFCLLWTLFRIIHREMAASPDKPSTSIDCCTVSVRLAVDSVHLHLLPYAFDSVQLYYHPWFTSEIWFNKNNNKTYFCQLNEMIWWMQPVCNVDILLFSLLLL